MPQRPSTPEDFWARINIKGPDECWEWKGFKSSLGYGSLSYQAKVWMAHRLAYSLFYKVEIEPGMVIMHTCDNPGCCNPHQLRQGTQKDNMHDRDRKHRNNIPQGMDVKHSKLKDHDIIEIRKLAYQGVKQKDIAEIFNVTGPAISLIISRKNWKHI